MKKIAYNCKYKKKIIIIYVFVPNFLNNCVKLLIFKYLINDILILLFWLKPLIIVNQKKNFNYLYI